MPDPVPPSPTPNTILGLRDRALIGVMCYSFARVSATINMRVEDYCQQGKRCWFRLHEKGGKRHEVPAHHKAEEYLDAYIAAAAGLPYSTCCHSWRATGIRVYLENGGVIEKAQRIAAHESPRTTKLYDRTQDELTLDEIERIAI